MCLGENIRYLRMQKGYSQDYIANKLGYKSYTTIQKWESGVSEPPVKVLKELSSILDADMNDMSSKKLFLGEESNKDYYINPDTRKLAEHYMKNSEMKMLFDEAMDASPEDLKTTYDMLLALKRKERGK